MAQQGAPVPGNVQPETAAQPNRERQLLTQQLAVAIAVGLLWWLCSALRHHWLQSNGFDLGIYDQVAWQISQGLEARSTILERHHMGNHGAWAFYLIGLPYRLWPSVQWLLASQALALSLTALPLAALWKQRHLPLRLSWLACLLWWLQPQVFNTNLFDFHPEVWAMPALAGAIWCSRAGRPLAWLLCLLWLLGCRDGLTLVVIGLGLSELMQRRWRWGAAAIGLGGGWLLLLSEWLYPLLNAGEQGPAALRRFSHLGASLPEILLNGLQQPWALLGAIPWGDLPLYLLLLALPTALFWRRASLPILSAALPLIAVNLLSSSEAQRNLVHHYNLPLAVLAVVAAIDGLRASGCLHWPWRRLAFAGFCWVVLAKPWFFTGPYLERIHQRSDLQTALQQIAPEARVLTSSHLAPQLSERPMIQTIRRQKLGASALQRFDVLLLNPQDPGWGSRRSTQIQALRLSASEGWRCRRWPSGLNLCQRP